MKKLFFFFFFCFPANAQDFKRLEKVADYIETISPGEFNMRHWETCAAGHATKVFSSEGLVIENKNLKYKIYYGIYAAIKFFDLDYGQAAYLFSDDDIGPQEEARKIRNFIARKQLLVIL